MAALRDIIVILDDLPASEPRLAIAVALAQQHGSHLTGLLAFDLLRPERPGVQNRSYPDPEVLSASSLLRWNAGRPFEDADRQVAEKAERVQAAFRERLRLAGVPGGWREVSGQVSEAVVRRTRHADLVILSQVDPNHLPPAAGRQLVADVLLTSGRPVLVVPYIGTFDTTGSRILVAWNNSREATRATHDAMPLLAKAASVTVLAVSPRGKEALTDDADLADLMHHFARHGIKAGMERTTAPDIPVSDALLGYAADIGANLMVAGGYGHSRMRERILGGVTNQLLQHMTLPTFLSH